MSHCRIRVSIVIAAWAAGALLSAAAGAAAAASPHQGPLESSLRRGRDALEQSKFGEAQDAFAAAIRLDPKSADAYHGAGLAAYSAGDYKAAIERLEKAVSLYDPPSRAAIHNLAAARLKTNPMRAAKLAKDYLSRPESPRDETLHNLLGRALFYGADVQARDNAAWAAARKFYFDYNTMLESSRTDGKKRWGAEWVPAQVATAKWSQIETRVATVERLAADVGRAAAKTKRAHNDAYEVRTDMRLHSNAEKRNAARRFNQAAKSEIALRHQLQAAESQLSQAEKPPLPEVFRMQPMDPPADVSARAAAGIRPRPEPK